MKFNIQLFGGRGASSSNRGYDGKVSLSGVGSVNARNASNLKKEIF